MVQKIDRKKLKRIAQTTAWIKKFKKAEVRVKNAKRNLDKEVKRAMNIACRALKHHS